MILESLVSTEQDSGPGKRKLECEVVKHMKKLTERAYEWFLELPKPAVLVLLWLARGRRWWA